MSRIHDQIMVALANMPGKRRNVAWICKYLNMHFGRGPYDREEVSSALMDLADEQSVQKHPGGRWMVADKRKGGSINRPDVPKPKSSLSARINRIRG
jgi:hypothetical protein